jgi:hypothetical protein
MKSDAEQAQIFNDVTTPHTPSDLLHDSQINFTMPIKRIITQSNSANGILVLFLLLKKEESY